MKIQIPIFIFFLLLLSSCQKENDVDNEIVRNPPPLSESPIDLEEVSADFAKDIAYDNKSRTVFDIWMPTSSTPTGLLIFAHGGGFIIGDKSYVYTAQQNGKWDFPNEIRTLLKNNIAVATVNYSLFNILRESDGVLKPMNDVKRALQYIRKRALDFNIDKDNIVLSGHSAGAGTALWIATNNDMKDASSSDLVLQESTRVKGIALRETQATYNTEKWIRPIFEEYNVTFEQMTNSVEMALSVIKLYGISSLNDYNTPEVAAYQEKVDMLSLLTSDDPEIWANNTLTGVYNPKNSYATATHHAYHVKELKKRADEVGVANVCYYGKNPILYSDPSNETWVDFIIRKIKE